MIVPGADGQSLVIQAVTVAEDGREFVSIVVEDNKSGPVAGIFFEPNLAEAVATAVRAAGMIAATGNEGRRPIEHPDAVVQTTKDVPR